MSAALIGNIFHQINDGATEVYLLISTPGGSAVAIGWGEAAVPCALSAPPVAAKVAEAPTVARDAITKSQRSRLPLAFFLMAVGSLGAVERHNGLTFFKRSMLSRKYRDFHG